MSKARHGHVFVVFGGQGDLMARKLLPALSESAVRGSVGEETLVLGVGRTDDLDDTAYRGWVRETLQDAEVSDEALDAWCGRCVYYQSIGDGEPSDYEALGERIAALEAEHGLAGHRVFYLAIPPNAFPSVIQGLGDAGLNDNPHGAARLVIEKPFGHDIASARELNKLVHHYFDESDVYRIDHYLGKETVQNLLVFRFANPIFESLWNRFHVDNVQITVAEDVGLEGRVGYYDGVGAIRDMIQNHLTQLLTLVAMEPPAAFEADAIRDEKVKVLRAVSGIDPDQDVVRGQYTRGRMGEQTVPGYHELDVPSDSTTETFAALRLEIDNWRWQGVPFYLRTGKRLPDKRSQIAITFREPPICLFEPNASCDPEPNVLLITLQPNEGFDLRFDAKVPTEAFELDAHTLRFRYQDVYGAMPDAYETLLIDVLQGDQTLFVRSDELETAWELYEPLLDRSDVETYAAGTWGPPKADALLEQEGRTWRTP